MIEINSDAGDYIPHDPPMQFIDTLVRVGENCAEATSCLAEDHIMATRGDVPIFAAIELMAQTVAAWSGYHDISAGKTPSVGLLLGTRKLNFSRATLPTQVEMSVKIERVLEAENGLSSFRGAVYLAGEEVASANLNVFRPTR